MRRKTGTGHEVVSRGIPGGSRGWQGDVAFQNGLGKSFGRGSYAGRGKDSEGFLAAFSQQWRYRLVHAASLGRAARGMVPRRAGNGVGSNRRGRGEVAGAGMGSRRWVNVHASG